MQESTDTPIINEHVGTGSEGPTVDMTKLTPEEALKIAADKYTEIVDVIHQVLCPQVKDMLSLLWGVRPSRQVQFALMDIKSIGDHLASLMVNGEIPPHAEVPVEAKSWALPEDYVHPDSRPEVDEDPEPLPEGWTDEAFSTEELNEAALEDSTSEVDGDSGETLDFPEKE